MSEHLVVILTDAQLDALAERVAAKIQSGNGNGHAPETDKLLTAAAAAQVLGVKPRWLYGHASTLPFVIKLPNSRAVRFSERGLAKWLERQRR